jgi:pimeloyl-ACP methyl ester carboxylesterase
MGSLSYADYLAAHGVHAFLVDLRGFGQSSSIQEQLVEDVSLVARPFSFDHYYWDIDAAVGQVRRILGSAVEITLVGFSFLGPLIVGYSHLNPGKVQKLLALNPSWRRQKGDPVSGTSKFVAVGDPRVPYSEVTMARIQDRLGEAQPPGRDFREPLWFEEASRALEQLHRSYDPVKGSWRVLKLNIFNLQAHIAAYIGMQLNRAPLLIVHSEYDTENPRYIVDRMMGELAFDDKELVILPNATHLCIWERAREDLYQITKEFALK